VLNIISELEEDHSEGESPYFAEPKESEEDKPIMMPQPVQENEEAFEVAEDGWDSPGIDPEMTEITEAQAEHLI